MSQRWTDSEVELLREEYPTTNTETLANKLERSPKSITHKARRIGVSKVDNFEILDSIHSVERRTFQTENHEFAHFICGFTAGEGSFCITNRDNRRDKLTFQISLSEVDSEILYEIKNFFGVGRVHEWDARDENWENEIQFIVQKIGALVNVIIPFFEKFELQNTNKKQQYNTWKNHLYTEYKIPTQYQT